MTFRSRPRHPVTGRRFWLSAPTKRELDAYLHRLDGLRTELKLGLRTSEEVARDLRHLQHGPATVERAAVSYLERPSLAKNTKRRVRALLESDKGAHLRPLLAVPLASLDGAVLAPWIEGLHRAGLHPTTIAMIWRTLRSLVRHGAERGWIGALPWGAWRPRLSGAPKRALREAARTMGELAAILMAARELDEDDLSYLPMASADREAKIACCALLGLRQGELGGLRWGDLEPPTVLVARQYEGRPLKMGAQAARIETVPELFAILERFRARRAPWWGGGLKPEHPIFPSPKSAFGKPRPYTGGQVLTSLQLRSAVRRAKLPHGGAWSPHSLRDTFVTLEVAARGGDLPGALPRTRHATVASLARYLRATFRDPSPPPALLLPGTTRDELGSPPTPDDARTDQP